MDSNNNIFSAGSESQKNDLYSSAPVLNEDIDKEASTCIEITETDKINEEPSSEVSEPTVQFDAVARENEVNKGTGIKVFFSLIAVTVALIIALAAGFVFGKTNEDSGLNIIAPNINSTHNLTATDYLGVYNKVNKSIVNVQVVNESELESYSVSGIIYSADGYIVINDCVYSGVTSPRFFVTIFDGSEYEAQYVAGDTRSNIAVIKIDAKNLIPASFGDYTELKTGDSVLAIGREGNAIPFLSSGIVSSVGTRVSVTYSSYSLKVIKTDIVFANDAFGASLVNMYGQIVGINADSTFGYSIPSTTIVAITDSLVKNGYVANRVKMGVTYVFNQFELNGLPKGMQVATVSADSSLANSNIKQGDIITHINDIELKTTDIALDIIESIKSGETVSLKVYHPDSKTSEVIHVVLADDKGSSSYSESILDEGGQSDKPSIFDDDSDSYKDH